MSHYLSFERDRGDEEQLIVHGNKEGLLYLSSLLRGLAEKIEKEQDHLHLMVPSWGGSGLSEEKMQVDGVQMKHVKIYGWREPLKKKA